MRCKSQGLAPPGVAVGTEPGDEFMELAQMVASEVEFQRIDDAVQRGQCSGAAEAVGHYTEHRNLHGTLLESFNVSSTHVDELLSR